MFATSCKLRSHGIGVTAEEGVSDDMSEPRWNALFADLESQAAAASAAMQATEIDETVRLEVRRITLVDRLRAAVGEQIRLRTVGAGLVAGQIARVGPDWLLLLEATGYEALVSLASVEVVTGLSRRTSAPGSMSRVEQRLGWGAVLRSVARDRSQARLHLLDGSVIDGVIDRVGADFVEVALVAAGDGRRAASVRDIAAVPLASLVMVRRQA